MNLSIYNILKEKINDVAAGNASSTAFVIPYEDVENFSSEDLNLNDIVNVLLANCPYELYWCDKTAGVGLQFYHPYFQFF